MSSEIKVSSVKAKDGTAGISIADSTGNVSLSGTLSAGTIGDNVVHENAKYYLQLKDGATGAVPSSSQMINNSGSTVPAFGAGTGDTTNIATANNHDYKLVKTGIYLIIFTVTAYQTGTGQDNLWTIKIRTNLSSPTTSEGTDEIALSNANVVSYDGNTDFSEASCSVIHNFSTANSLINFLIDDIPNVSKFHASICLIRPT